MLGGARSGKSRFAEGRAAALGGGSVLYVATAMVGAPGAPTGDPTGDPELARRVAEHRERRPGEWGTMEMAGGSLSPVPDAAEGWGAVLLDSLTLWVSARMLVVGEEAGTLEAFEEFVWLAGDSSVPFVLVSDEVGLGLVPEGAEARRFRDLLGLVNQRAAEAAREVHLCVAGVAMRIR